MVPRDLMNMRDTKFTVVTVFPPEKQKFLIDKMHELAGARGETLQGPARPATQLFTLDEALNYFTKLKETQDRFDAQQSGGA